MGQLFSRLKQALAGESDALDGARRALLEAYEARIKVWLEPILTSVRNSTLMSATIEQVRDGDLVISQPTIGGVMRPLMTGEALRLSFSLGTAGHLSGNTEVLGRHEIPSGGTAPLLGYLLAIPGELGPSERREADRNATNVNLAREVELYYSETADPIRGVVQNLSVGGMQIRTHESQPRLTQGQRVRLVVHLPAPVGAVNRMVRIARLAKGSNPRQQVVGISFDREIEGLTELLGGRRGRIVTE